MSTDGNGIWLRWAVAAGGVVVFCSGCAWLQPPAPGWSPPPVFSSQPTLEEVIRVVNGNSGRIESFWADGATLSGSGMPTLRASIAFQRPRRFRLQAETGLGGPELDVGSNDELFWIWVRRNEPKAVYYCRHGEFAFSPVRQTLPIEPDWLIEALGITEFDPALAHQGPFPRPGGRLEVRTVIDAPEGPSTKVTVVDGRTGLVWEQYVYDVRGELVASAVTRGHRRDPLTGLILPQVVDIRCPRADLDLRIDLGTAVINRPESIRPGLFVMPRYPDWPAVNLCDPPAASARTAPGPAHRHWPGVR